jgi:hypothetical protein
MGGGCIDPRYRDLGTSWRWVVNFTPRPLYSRRKSSPVPIGQEVFRAPESFRPLWRSESSWAYRDSNSGPSVVQPVASRYTDCAVPSETRNCMTGMICTCHVIISRRMSWTWHSARMGGDEKFVQYFHIMLEKDRPCGLLVRVPGYSYRSPGLISGATEFSEK